MPSPAITVENLSKAYRIGLKEEVPDSLVGAIQGLLRAPWENLRRLRRLNTFGRNGDAEDTIWALNDVSFEVTEGEVVGIIGRNGAGKSTLLKILSRITEPTSGRAVIRGRVSSLLEVGTGFHPELTGRENIYMNGTILGMTKREIDRKFDEIVDFSGVEKFLDTPIKRYSSGMQVRLAFSVAAHLEPEILIVDEVLAVGDAEFQKKCVGKMQNVARGGRTVLFVSHNFVALSALCQRGLVLTAGALSFDAPIHESLKFYAAHTAPPIETTVDLTPRLDRTGSGALKFSRISVRGTRLNAPTISMGDDIIVTLQFGLESPLKGWNAGFHILDQQGILVCRVITRDTLGDLPRITSSGEIRCRLRELRLLPGTYSLTLVASLNSGREILDHLEDAIRFEVSREDVYGTGSIPQIGIVFARCEWQIETVDDSLNLSVPA